MAENKSIIKVAQRLLKKQNKLHPELFGNDGRMFDEVRNKFLKITDFLIKKYISPIPYAEVSDIVLVGSSASYLYHEGSDFDVRIFLRIKDSPVIVSSPEAAAKFQAMIGAVLFSAERFKINNHAVDIKIGNGYYDNMGNYSISENKWKIVPNSDIGIEHLKCGELVQGYYQQLQKLYDFLASLKTENGKYLQEDSKKIGIYFKQQTSIQEILESDIKSTIKKLLVFKLMVSQGKIRELQQTALMAFNNSLSI